METTYQVISTLIIVVFVICLVPMTITIVANMAASIFKWWNEDRASEKGIVNLTKKPRSAPVIFKQVLYTIDEKWLATWQKEKGAPKLTITTTGLAPRVSKDTQDE